MADDWKPAGAVPIEEPPAEEWKPKGAVPLHEDKTSASGAAAHHAANSLLFGFGDELRGLGARVGASKPGQYLAHVMAIGADHPVEMDGDAAYKASRDAERNELATEQNEHPYASLGGDVAGGVGSAIMTAPLAPASAAGRIALQTGLGALRGYGESNADSVKGQLIDTGKSAAMNALFQGGAEGVGSFKNWLLKQGEERLGQASAQTAAQAKTLADKEAQRVSELRQKLGYRPGDKIEEEAAKGTYTPTPEEKAIIEGNNKVRLDNAKPLLTDVNTIQANPTPTAEDLMEQLRQKAKLSSLVGSVPGAIANIGKNAALYGSAALAGQSLLHMPNGWGVGLGAMWAGRQFAQLTVAPYLQNPQTQSALYKAGAAIVPKFSNTASQVITQGVSSAVDSDGAKKAALYILQQKGLTQPPDDEPTK